jgi:hypothetical protein
MSPDARVYDAGVASRLPDEWRVPAAFAALTVGTLLYNAAHTWFWQRAHEMAWLAAPTLLLLLCLLLLRRSRVAWWIFVSFGVVGLVSWPIEAARHHVTAGWILGALVGSLELGLLVSPHMRRFVRFRGRLAASPA